MDTSGSTRSGAELGPLIAELQSLGLRVEAPMEEAPPRRSGPRRRRHDLD